MIVATPEGAVVEILWQRRGGRLWSQVAALRFLSTYRLTREGLRGLRWLLCDRADPGIIWRSSDDAILQRTAQLMAIGALVVARFEDSKRAPSSGFILESGTTSSVLLWRDQLRLNRDLYHMRESLEAVKAVVIASSQKKKVNEKKTQESGKEQAAAEVHTHYIGELRRMLASCPGLPNLDPVPDVLFLDLLIGYFESGELIPIYRLYPAQAEEQRSDSAKWRVTPASTAE